MAQIDDILIPSLLFEEQASDIDTPPSGGWRFYFKAGGLYARDDAGTVVGPFATGTGDVATDPIWTTAGKVARATGTATATEQWAPGHQFDYAALTTATVDVTATTEGTADTIVTGNAVTYDGAAVNVEFYCPDLTPDGTAASRVLEIWLYLDGSSVGKMGTIVTPTANALRLPHTFHLQVTPAAGSHTYSIRGTVSAGTGKVRSGAGGAGNQAPSFIRIRKV